MLAGSLTEFSLQDVFTLLSGTRKTGVLNLQGDATGRVWILGGRIAFAVADTAHSQLAARLLHGGEIEPPDVEALVHAQASGNGVQMAAALAGVGIGADRAETLLHDQVVDATFDLSRWPSGEFNFDAALDAPPADAIPTFAADEVMRAVEARILEWDGIVATLPSPASVLRPVARPQTPDGVITIRPDQWEIMTLVDGIRTVADVIHLTGQGQFVVAKLLASLVDGGLLQIREDQTGLLTPTQLRAAHLAKVEHEVLGAPAPREQQSAPAPAPLQPVAVAEPQPAAAEPEPVAEPVAEPEPLIEPEPAVDVDALLEAEPAAEAVQTTEAAAAADVDLDAILGRSSPQADVEQSTEVSLDQPADRPQGGGVVDEDLLARLIDGVKGA